MRISAKMLITTIIVYLIAVISDDNIIAMFGFIIGSLTFAQFIKENMEMKRKNKNKEKKK